VAFVVKDAVREPLYAIVPYFDPWRWKSREKHTLRAIKHFADAGAVVVLVEAAFNRRDFVFADSGLDGTLAECNVLGERKFKHRYIGLRTRDELWLKENLINVAAGWLPHDWQQLCWLDSDVHFVRPNWVGECIHKLQHYSFLQMFSQARDIGPNYEMLNDDYPHASGQSFIHAHVEGTLDLALNPTLTLKLDLAAPNYYPPRVWPGLAWACTRQAYDDVGGLLDFAVWGGGDWHMAHALIERPQQMMRNDLHPNYKQKVVAWMDRCKRHIRRNVGKMDGSIFHYFHGRNASRGNKDKHALLSQIAFDPVHHLKRDYQGLYQLHDDGTEAYIKMRDGMRKIALERNEDANEI
jgi:hypothetical protein